MLNIENNQIVLDQESSNNFHNILNQVNKKSLALRQKYLKEIMGQNNCYEDGNGVHILIEDEKPKSSYDKYSILKTILTIENLNQLIEEFIDVSGLSKTKINLKHEPEANEVLVGNINNIDDSRNAAA